MPKREPSKSMTEANPPPFEIGGRAIDAGRRVELELRPARLPSGGWMAIPVVVLRGRKAGPTIWLSAAVHGDEVCGVEIIRQVIGELDPKTMAGTVIAVPVVNVPGFASGDRYMPDRRDLNRCFPGSARGSLASRFAHVFMSEIVSHCSVGIDLHTGSDHRRNLPQIRADFDDPETRELASVFGAPVALHARVRDGSLREAAVSVGARALVYEAGEAWRFDQQSIDVGVAGVYRVLVHLGITDSAAATNSEHPAAGTEPLFLKKSSWVRSPVSGVARIAVELGTVVEPRETLGVVTDAVGSQERVVRASKRGIVIARTELPVVHRGDALVHLGNLDQNPPGSSKGSDD